MRVGQFREVEALSKRELLWTALGFLAAAGILIFAPGCKTLSQIPTDCRTFGCKGGKQCVQVGKNTGLPAPYDYAYSCEPEPTSPPVTQPSPEPTSTPTAPPTPAAGCVLPDQAGWAAGPDQSAVRLDAVRAALDVVRQEHPDWFTDQGMRLANRTAAGVDALYDELGRVVARSGLCGGQVREYGGRLDKFGMMRPDGGLEAYHLVEYGGFRVQSPIKVNSVWVPPSQQPTPAPTAAPAKLCPAPRPESYRNPATKQDCLYVWGYGAHPARWRDAQGGLVQGLDATLNVSRCCGFCEATGQGTFNGAIRCQCPLRPEGNPEREVCEAEVGAVWQARGGVLVPNPGNRAQASCEGTGCEERVCTGDGSACGEWRRMP